MVFKIFSLAKEIPGDILCELSDTGWAAGVLRFIRPIFNIEMVVVVVVVLLCSVLPFRSVWGQLD